MADVMDRLARSRFPYPLVLGALLAGLCVSPPIRAAQPAGDQAAAAKSDKEQSLLATGKALFEDQRYEESIQTLSAALLRPNLTRRERIEVYRYLAYNYITLSRDAEADAAVRGLFSLDPDFRLAKTESPRFRSFFEKVRTKWEAEGRPGLVKKKNKKKIVQVRLQHASPAKWEKGKPLTVSGQIAKGQSRVAKVVIHYRPAGTKKFRKASASLRHGRFQAVIPANAIKPPMLEYYIEAIGSNGLPVASRGDVAAPLRVSVPRQEASGILSSPWFWVAASVVAVGGATGAYLLSRDNGGGILGGDNHDEGPPMSRVVVVVGE